MAYTKKKSTRTTAKSRAAKRPARSSRGSNNLLVRLRNNRRAMALLSIVVFALIGYAIYNSAKADVRPLGTEVTGVGNLVAAKSDEFNGTSLDLSKWRPNWLAGSDTTVTPPINSGEESCYDPKQVSVGGGTLKLKAESNSSSSCKTRSGSQAKFKSGMVQTDADIDDYKYGYYEARVYFPGSGGRVSNFPAFWTNGQPTWPANGEIDIVEGLGGIVRAHYHGPNGSAGSPDRNPSWMPDATGWHVYGMKREKGRVTFYYDGRQIWTHTNGVVDSPHFVIFNNGISRDHGGPQVVPATMEVDYFRFWELGSGTGTTPTTNNPPSVSLGSLNSSYTAPATINLTATASDSDGIAKVEFYNGSTKLGEDTTSPYSYSWSNVGAGNYSVTAKAYDTKGVAASSSARTFTVNGTSTTPTPTPQEPSTSNGGPTVTFAKLQSNYSVGSSVTLSVSASDADGVHRASFYDGDNWLGTDTTAPYSHTMSNLSAGTYKIYVRVTDNAGNTTTTETQTFTVSSGGSTGGGGSADTQAPSAPSNLLSSLRMNWGTLKYVLDLRWTASTDNVGVANYIVTRDGNQIGTPTTPGFTDTAELTAGQPYVYTVYAVDAAGNKSGALTNVIKTQCTFIWCQVSEQVKK